MIRPIKTFLRKFRRDEDGQMLIEFTLLIPLIFTIFLTSVEMGMYQVRLMFLERGLDETIRLVRLGTGTPMQHDEIKRQICERAGFLEECEDNLRLEMKPINPRNFENISGGADCIDTSEPVAPLREFSLGGDHDLMIMRACYKFNPVFGTTGLGRHFVKDGAGKAKMVATSAFVQEPR